MKRYIKNSAYMRNPVMQYYKKMSPEDAADAFTYINDDVLQDMGYRATILGWYEAKPGYYDSLSNMGLQEVMLVSEGGEPFLGYVVHDRLYEVTQDDIIDCLMDEDVDYDEVGP